MSTVCCGGGGGWALPLLEELNLVKRCRGGAAVGEAIRVSAKVRPEPVGGADWRGGGGLWAAATACKQEAPRAGPGMVCISHSVLHLGQSQSAPRASARVVPPERRCR
jgi:hypothetical protein